MRFAIRLIGILSVILVALVACSSGSNLGELLPLADDKPTFIFFYTDN